MRLENLPFTVGVPEAPYVGGELRDRWNADKALFLGAWANIWLYCTATIDKMAKGIRPDPTVLPRELRPFHQ